MIPTPNYPSSALLLAGSLLLVPPGAAAQGDPVQAESTRAVAPGPHYAMGALGRFFWGDHYRDAWTTPIACPVLDLGTFAGGLTPLRRGGGRQTRSLRFAGADGKEYSFRSLDKDPGAALPPMLRTTIARDVLQDQISSQHPLGALVAAPILEAAGVLHAEPQLALLPDDPRLGEFREEFAGMMGLIEERPDENEDALAAFAGADQVIGSETLFERLEASPSDRVNARAFLNARLLDFFLGDWDRHADQWRWARFATDSTRGWYPIPRDRDQVFSKLDGVIPAFAEMSAPQITGFTERIHSVLGLHWNSRELDRRLLSDLEEAVWDSVAGGITERLTDAVIERAVRQLPPELYAIDGAWLTTALKLRRDGLVQAAHDFYHLVAREVEVYATDEPELVRITGRPDGTVEVEIGERGGPEAAYYRRRFDPDQTREVRIYLRGGDDEVVVEGATLPRPKVRVVGGGGDDRYRFESSVPTVRLYDARGDNTVTGPSAGGGRITRKPYNPGSNQAVRYWGATTLPVLILGYGTDYGFLIGGGASRVTYGFRKDPYSGKVKLAGAFSTEKRFDALLEVDLRRQNSKLHGRVKAFSTSLDVIHFFGFGNDSPQLVSVDFHKVFRRVFSFESLILASYGPNLDITLGPALRYSNTSENTDRYIGTLPGLYGAGSFGQVGITLGTRWDTRGSAAFEEIEHVDDLSGVGLDVSAFFYPAVWDVTSPYGSVEAVARGYIPTFFPPHSVLALRAGTKKVWGEYPWYDAAFLGGDESLRGWRSQRFAGDAVLYGAAELRLHVAQFNLVTPNLLGVFGAVDAGRVWVDGESPGGYHLGYGGGIWVGFLGARNVISVSWMQGKETEGLYFGLGFEF